VHNKGKKSTLKILMLRTSKVTHFFQNQSM